MTETETKFFTLEEISKNTGLNGTRCWLLYKNVVYDVTDYLDEHPGGPELVTEYGGKECTKAFDDAGHSGDAKKMLKPYLIGELAEEDRKKKNAKPAKAAKPEVKRSFISIITCGLCG